MGHVAWKGGANLLHQVVGGCWQRHTRVLWCPLWVDRHPPAPAANAPQGMDSSGSAELEVSLRGSCD